MEAKFREAIIFETSLNFILKTVAIQSLPRTTEQPHVSVDTHDSILRIYPEETLKMQAKMNAHIYSVLCCF